MVIISTDKSKVDLGKIVRFLHEESYWAKSRSKDQIVKSIENSLCFIMMEDQEMIGFARVVTDYGVFAYLADVFIDKDHRGKGLGKELMQEILNHPDLQLIARWMLGTLDAQELYRQYGFNEIAEPFRWMEFMPNGSEIS